MVKRKKWCNKITYCGDRWSNKLSRHIQTGLRSQIINVTESSQECEYDDKSPLVCFTTFIANGFISHGLTLSNHIKSFGGRGFYWFFLLCFLVNHLLRWVTTITKILCLQFLFSAITQNFLRDQISWPSRIFSPLFDWKQKLLLRLMKFFYSLSDCEACERNKFLNWRWSMIVVKENLSQHNKDMNNHVKPKLSEYFYELFNQIDFNNRSFIKKFQCLKLF